MVRFQTLPSTATCTTTHWEPLALFPMKRFGSLLGYAQRAGPNVKVYSFQIDFSDFRLT
jgi:hypothetical protein